MNKNFLFLILFSLSHAVTAAQRPVYNNEAHLVFSESKQDKHGQESKPPSFPILSSEYVSFQMARLLNEPSPSPEPGNGTDSNKTNTDPCHAEGSGVHGRRLNEPAVPDCKEEYIPAIPFWQIWIIFIGCGVTLASAVFVVWYYKELVYKPLPSSDTKENPAVVAQKRAKELEVARSSVSVPIQPPQLSTPTTKSSGKKNSRNVGEIVDPEKEREFASKAFSLPPPPPPLPQRTSSSLSDVSDSTKPNEYIGSADPTQVDIAIREAASVAANASHQRRLDRIAAASGAASSASKKREFAPQAPGSVENSGLAADESAAGSLESTNLSARRIEESVPSSDVFFNGGDSASDVSRRESADEEANTSAYNSREIMEFSSSSTEPTFSSTVMPRAVVPIDLPKIPTKPKIISIPKPVSRASLTSSSLPPSFNE